MKAHRLLVLALATLAACGKPASPTPLTPPAPSPPQPATSSQPPPQETAPRELPPPESPAPQSGPTVDLRINGRARALVPLPMWRGEPVIAEVVLRHPDRTAQEPLVLDPPDGGWSTRVKVAVTDAGGAAEPWTFVVTGRPSNGALTLRPDAVTTLVLRVASPDPVRTGRRRLVARLELADGRGWRGMVESEAVEVELIEPPAAPAGAALGRRQILRARDALLAGDLPRAEAAADAMVTADPARPEGFVARALVAEAMGDARLALLAIDTAIAKAAGVEPKPKPVPFEYYDLRRRFEAMAEK